MENKSHLHLPVKKMHHQICISFKSAISCNMHSQSGVPRPGWEPLLFGEFPVFNRWVMSLLLFQHCCDLPLTSIVLLILIIHHKTEQGSQQHVNYTLSFRLEHFWQSGDGATYRSQGVFNERLVLYEIPAICTETACSQFSISLRPNNKKC